MKKTLAMCAFVLLICMLITSMSSCQYSDYKKAILLYEKEEYEAATYIFESLGEYKDAKEMVTECTNAVAYKAAYKKYEDGIYNDAYNEFLALNDYKDSSEMAKESLYVYAKQMFEAGLYDVATSYFKEITDYKDSAEWALKALDKQFEELCKWKVADSKDSKGTVYGKAVSCGGFDGKYSYGSRSSDEGTFIISYGVDKYFMEFHVLLLDEQSKRITSISDRVEMVFKIDGKNYSMDLKNNGNSVLAMSVIRKSYRSDSKEFGALLDALKSEKNIACEIRDGSLYYSFTIKGKGFPDCWEEALALTA